MHRYLTPSPSFRNLTLIVAATGVLAFIGTSCIDKTTTDTPKVGASEPKKGNDSKSDEQKYFKRKEQKVFIVKINNSDKNDNVFEEELAALGSQEAIVLGIEGFSRNETSEANMVKYKYGLRKGMIFGYENPFLNLYMSLKDFFEQLETSDEVAGHATIFFCDT